MRCVCSVMSVDVGCGVLRAKKDTGRGVRQEPFCSASFNSGVVLFS